MPEEYEYVKSEGHPVHTFKNSVTGEEVIIKFNVEPQEAHMAQKASDHAYEIRKASNSAVNIPRVISDDFDVSELSDKAIQDLSDALNKDSPISTPISREHLKNGHALVMEKANGPDLQSIIDPRLGSSTVTLKDLENMSPDWNGLRAGVEEMNKLKITHKDLSAGNIIISESEGRAVFNIYDWGGPKDIPADDILPDAKQLENLLSDEKLAGMIGRYDAKVAQEAAQSAEALQAAKKVSALTEIRDAYKGVRTLREALTATKSLSKGAKMTLVGGVAVGAGVLYAITHTHEAQRDLAKNLLEQGLMTQEAYDEYIELNKDIEHKLLAENVVSQGPAFILTTPLLENYAKEEFAEFSIRHNLKPEVHEALGMSMFDEKSLGAQFAQSAVDIMPDKIADVDPALHSLWRTAQALNTAQVQVDYTQRTIWGGSRLGPINEPTPPTQAEKDKAVLDLNIAENAHRTEFARVLSNEYAGNKLLSLMPEDILIDMATQTAPHQRDELHPLISQLSYAQQKLDAHIQPLYDDPIISREPNPRYELISAKNDLREKPEVLREYLRNTFGGEPVEGLEQTNHSAGYVGPSREEMDRALNMTGGAVHNFTEPTINNPAGPLDWQNFQNTIAPLSVGLPLDYKLDVDMNVSFPWSIYLPASKFEGLNDHPVIFRDNQEAGLYDSQGPNLYGENTGSAVLKVNP
tara:strand:+ start:7907 stop:9985 length:2079 start_codon:yes stop_codon:yes gene_type:complete